ALAAARPSLTRAVETPTVRVFAVATPPSRRSTALAAWTSKQSREHWDRIADRPLRSRGVVWASDWHAALQRGGGAQLNDRFAARFHRPMDEAAWHGWVAVKAAVEAALRPHGGGPGAAFAALVFDGHLSAPLRFDAAGVLVHPMFVVRGDGSAEGELVGPAR